MNAADGKGWKSRIAFLLLLSFFGGSFTSLGPRASAWAARGLMRILAGPRIIDTIQTMESPKGEKILTVRSINSGGATVDFRYEILLSPKFPERTSPAGARVWRSYGLKPRDIRWLTEDVVEVTIPAPSPGKLRLLERWPKEGALIVERLSL